MRVRTGASFVSVSDAQSVSPTVKWLRRACRPVTLISPVISSVIISRLDAARIYLTFFSPFFCRGLFLTAEAVVFAIYNNPARFTATCNFTAECKCRSENKRRAAPVNFLWRAHNARRPNSAPTRNPRTRNSPSMDLLWPTFHGVNLRAKIVLRRRFLVSRIREIPWHHVRLVELLYLCTAFMRKFYSRLVNYCSFYCNSKLFANDESTQKEVKRQKKRT